MIGIKCSPEKEELIQQKFKTLQNILKVRKSWKTRADIIDEMLIKEIEIQKELI